MEHYFSKNPQIKSKQTQYSAVVLEKHFSFFKDNGVFSKDNLDKGTYLFLKHFTLANLSAKTALDIGAGTGEISIILAKFFKDLKILGLEINERAVLLAKKNSDLNGVENVSFQQCDFLEFETSKTFDLIVSNPPIKIGKQNLFKFYEKASALLSLNGQFSLVVKHSQGAESHIKFLKTLFKLVEFKKDATYYLISCFN